MPCGIPDQQWPYSASIDTNNGLRYDTNTGKLWTHPNAVSDSRVVEGVRNFTGSAVITAPDGAHRVNWSPLAGAVGFSGTYTMQQTPVVYYTNNSAREMVVRSLTVQIPNVGWNTNYQVRRSEFIVQVYAGNNSLPAVYGDRFTPNWGTYTGAAYGGGNITGSLQTTGMFADNITSSIDPLLDATVIGRQTLLHPRRTIDAVAAMGSTVITPGQTWQFRADLIAVAPVTPTFLNGGFPDHPFNWAFADVYQNIRLRLNVETYQP